jgi:hypothetical protein
VTDADVSVRIYARIRINRPLMDDEVEEVAEKIMALASEDAIYGTGPILIGPAVSYDMRRQEIGVTTHVARPCSLADAACYLVSEDMYRAKIVEFAIREIPEDE